MSNGIRRHFTPQQKAEVVRRHVTGKEPVSKLAEELCVQPSQIHGWVNQVLAQAEAAFRRAGKSRRDEQRKDEKLARLEAKLVQKNEVIAELMEENVRAKKASGDL
jgi:transposase-like protein